MRFTKNQRAGALRSATVLPLVCGLGALLAGCAHESATTTVHSNGSWTRRAEFSMAQNDDPKAGVKLRLKDVFAPPSGSGWKVEEALTDWKPKQQKITAVKEVGATETITGDLTVKSAVKKAALPVRVVNSATVRAAGAGRWLYTETFHWVGAKPSVEKDMEPLIRLSVKKALPKAFATDVNARALGARLERTLWKTLFSPPEPLLLDFYDNLLPITGLSNPDDRTALMVRRLGPGIEAALQETFGAGMSRDQRHQTAINLAHQITADTGEQAGKGDKMGGGAGKAPGMDGPNESFGGLYPVAITLVLKIPGRVVETNGLADDLTGEIYWTLYPQAALQQDVTLRALFEMTPKQEAAARRGAASIRPAALLRSR